MVAVADNRGTRVVGILVVGILVAEGSRGNRRLVEVDSLGNHRLAVVGSKRRAVAPAR